MDFYWYLTTYHMNIIFVTSNTTFFMRENWSKYIVCNKAAIVFRPQCSKLLCLTEIPRCNSLCTPIFIQPEIFCDFALPYNQSAWPSSEKTDVLLRPLITTYIFSLKTVTNIQGQMIALNIMMLVHFNCVWLQKLHRSPEPTIDLMKDHNENSYFSLLIELRVRIL